MRKGFTLIELLIVIMVIAILIGIALPRFGGMRDEASTAKAAAELRTLQTAVESHYIHSIPVHAYPPAGANWEAHLTSATPKIISSVLYDPFGATSTSQYNYAVSSNGQYYIIQSNGINRTSTITGISDTGTISGGVGDDIYVSNGASGTGGF